MDIRGDNYSVAKAVDNVGALEALHQKNPSAVIIYRKYYDDGEQTRRINDMNNNMQAELDRWFMENADAIHRLPYALFESYNEVGAPGQYLEFERQRAIRLASMGGKPLVLNIGSGQTSTDMWKSAAAMVDAATKAGGAVGTHNYALGVMSASADASYWDEQGNWQGPLFPTNPNPDKCWTALRILKDKKDLAAQGQGNTWMISTETGLDDMGDESKFPRYYPLQNKVRGWRDCIGVWQRLGWLNGISAEAFYIKQLQWWATTTQCLGVIYTFGTGGDVKWNSFDTTGAM